MQLPQRNVLPASASAPVDFPETGPKPINLFRGWPCPWLLPAAAISQATASVLLSGPEISTPVLQYGPDQGYDDLRVELARWLRDFYSRPDADARDGTTYFDRLTITGGASQSTACILQSYTDPGYTRAVWVIAPCYFLACPIFADNGFTDRMRAVPEDVEGVNLEYLERAIEEMEQQEDEATAKGGFDGSRSPDHRFKDPAPFRKTYRHVIYCVPSFANPSGRTISLRRRQGLLRLARKWDALLLCDDVYDMLQWSTPISDDKCGGSSIGASSPNPSVSTVNSSKAMLPRLVDLEADLGPSPHDPPGRRFGHAVSNGSFSKIAAPGIRTGWTDSTPDFAFGLAYTGSTRSGGAPSQLCAAALSVLLRDGFLQQHIATALLPVYARRWAIMMGTVDRVLGPLGVVARQDVVIVGGYFIWIRLPARGPRAQELADRCAAQENLVIGEGSLFEVPGDEGSAGFGDEVRLCFTWEEEGTLIEGIERMGRVLAQMIRERDRDQGARGGAVMHRPKHSIARAANASRFK
ncbi:pyridoxal phosphate-dependent transferase [Xylariales sp. PMI_506]|nr:pyridoxal phosphate-dependent transferase [Xylariales sp. PMI_506]